MVQSFLYADTDRMLQLSHYFIIFTRFLPTMAKGSTARQAGTRPRWCWFRKVCCWLWLAWPRPSWWPSGLPASSAASKAAVGESLPSRGSAFLTLKLSNLRCSCVWDSLIFDFVRSCSAPMTPRPSETSCTQVECCRPHPLHSSNLFEVLSLSSRWFFSSSAGYGPHLLQDSEPWHTRLPACVWQSHHGWQGCCLVRDGPSLCCIWKRMWLVCFLFPLWVRGSLANEILIHRISHSTATVQALVAVTVKCLTQ